MQALQSAYQFDDEALRLNRAGQVSDSQGEILAIYSRNAKWGVRGAFIAGIVTAGVIIGGWALSNPLSRNSFRGEATAFAIIGVVVLLFLLYSRWSYRRIANRLNQAEILHIEGAVKKSQKTHGYTKITSYHLRINQVNFQVDTKKKWEVIQDGEQYRIHYIDYPPTNIVLSVELVD